MELPSPTPAAQARPSAVRELLQSLVLYVEARLRLLQIESREAGSHLVGLVILVALCLGSLLGAWLIAMPALIWLIAHQSDWHWSRVALAAAAFHLLLGIILISVLKSRLHKLRLFEESLNQFQKDRAWIAPQAP
jgi:uncharacterized membrane protein YqjE